MMRIRISALAARVWPVVPFVLALVAVACNTGGGGGGDGGY
jgi:hypothetical protein